ncbi:MAG: thiamine-phosphate kinase, partial [Chromatiales bacterium]|nr:thiamine-phosphate kinase [Chromatiales bacterium]
MALSEFDLIQHYFSQLGRQRQDVTLGVGDDCALLAPMPGHLLAVSMDTLVAGVHFYADTDPERLGHKALAVNLSDLAAMGATPAWATLALTLPDSNSQWLEAFSRGFTALALQHNLQLVGGDTTNGPLTITVQVHGWVKEELALRRDQARAGDLIYVTGTLGDAGLALAGLQGSSVAVPYLE